MQNRIAYIDALRGFAILLVIVGHLIQFNYSSGIENPIFNIIYSFHMPLFFFISGCARSISESYRGGITNLKELVRFYWKSFLTLIVPALSWTYLVPLFFTGNGEPQEFKFWFLSVLFVIMLIWGGYSYIYHKLGKRTWVTYMLVCGIAILFLIGIKRIPLMYLSMFILGYYFQEGEWLHKIHSHVYSVMLFCFLLIVGYFSYGDTSLGSADRVWLEFPLSIIASLVLTRLFAFIEQCSYKITKTFAFIGMHTIGIYLCHFYFVEIPVIEVLENMTSNMLQFVLLFIIAYSIAILCASIQYMTKIFSFVNGVLYGQYNKITLCKSL